MDENPSTETLNQPAGEDTSSETSSVETTTTSPASPAAGESEGTSQGTQTADAPADGENGEHQPERPAQRRIRELVSENKRLQEEQSRFLQMPTGSQPTQKFSDMVQGREEIDPAELDKLAGDYAAQTGGATASLEVAKLRFEMSQDKAVNQYESDQVRVEATYPELNPDSDKYNPVLERAIAETWKNEAVQTQNGLRQINQSVRLTDVAKRYMDAIQSAVERNPSSSTNQTDTLSVTPNATPAREDVAFDDLSLAEQRKYLKSQGYKV